MKLNVNFTGTTDTTGYLFSLAKCLSASLICGGSEELADIADDIVATSGFAFRMWVAPDLCPSATSIWEFAGQKRWCENGGLAVNYTERLWGQDNIEVERRLAAISQIERGIDSGVASVAWDLSDCEWGIVRGYDDENLYTLKINGDYCQLPKEKLGRLELPILSVLTPVGRLDKSREVIVADTKALAASHLRGEEWCDNAKGIAAYDALIGFIKDKLDESTLWNLEYYLGTYAALKWYAWKFFDKYGEGELASLYQRVHFCWQDAFKARSLEARDELCRLLTEAKECEVTALKLM